MKKVFIFLFTYLCFGFLAISFPQEADNPFTQNLRQLLENRTQSEKKVESGIYYKFHQYSKNIKNGNLKSEAIKVFNRKNYKIDNSNRILLNIKLNSKDENEMMSVVNKIKLFDGKIESTHKGKKQLSEIFCWLPVDQIPKLSNVQEIGSINNPGNAVFWSEEYTTIGDDQLKASDVRSTFNVDGTGYKIGVISDGVQSYFLNDIPAEELENVTILHPGFAGDEGTAMLEIIHDIAPGAQLYFHGLDNTPNYFEFKDAISALVAAECDIIVDDIGFDDEPYFTDWTDLGEVIRNFINQGGVYISSAGNAKKEILMGSTNFDNLYHKFTDENTYLNVNLPEGSAVILQWKDSWILPTNDFNLEIYDQQNNLIAGGNNTQTTPLPPIEVVQIENAGTYKIKIKNISGSDNTEFKLWPRGTEISNNGSNQIFGHSAFPNVISVAAYQGDDETVVSDYSSGGPATMFSTAIFDWTTQDVPTITATSGVETFVGTTGLWSGGDPVFSGTSASAPHIAGLAALYFQKLNSLDQLNKSNFDFIYDLKVSGDNIDNYTGGTWNYESGYGKANILDAINQAGITVSAPVLTPLSGTYYLTVNCSISCETPGASIYYTDNGQDPTQQTGTSYSVPFTITSDKTIKAKAFKTGMLSSSVKSETYDITNLVAPILDKSTGEYLTNTQVNITWPVGQDLRLYYQIRTDGSIPPDPSNSNFGQELQTHPGRYFIVADIQKIKFRIADFTNYSNPTWGPVVYVEYTGKPGLRIAQIDDEITQGNNSFGEWNKWENDNHWAPHPDETIFRPTQTADWYLKALQDFKDPANNVFRKYNVWTINGTNNFFVNHAKVPIGSTTSSVLAHFKQSYDVTVTNKLENSFSVNQGSFIIKNPWIVDDNSDSKGPRNRGDGAVVPLSPYTINFSTTPNITTGSIHKGVFLNQGITPQGQWQPPYYSVKVDEALLDVPLTQTGKTHRFYFQNWDGTDVNYKFPTALETPVVFNQEGSVALAVYKGTQLSNTTAAYSNNSQRKFLRTTYGTAQLNSVYESLNRVWYEASTDGGSTWSIKNNGSPLSPVYSTSPSISTVIVPDNAWVLITFAESYDNSPSTSDIRVMRIIPSTSQIVQQLTITDGYSDALFNNPVIASNANQSTNTHFVLVYELKTYDNFNDWAPGIYYLVGYVPVNGFYFEWLGSPTLIPGTNASSFTPAISTNYNHYTYTCEYTIAWEQRTSSNSSKIQSRTLSVSNLNSWNTTLSPTTINISDDCGFVKNYAPSLITMNNNVVKAVWQGARQVTADETPTGPQHINALTNWEYKTVYKDLTTGTKKIYGTKTNLPTINKLDNNSEFFFAYSEQSDLAAKVVLGSDIRTICQLDANGKDVQIGNGSTLNSAKANLFKPTSLPYYFNLSTNMEHVTPKKNNLAILSGREGIVFKDSAQFYFAVGDVLVDNIPVTFKSLSDTLNINTIGQVNEFLETESFTLSDNSIFYYSVQYGVTDSIAAAMQLTNNRSINFKVELLDVVTGSIIGSFDDVVYSENSFYQYNNIAYQVNAAGIGNTQVKLRLLINSSGDFDYSLTERFAEESVLGKNQIKQLNLDGSGLVKEYSLAQNFPNPFNPSTTIRYQIPQDGIVTLKIYDILGSEVATLVNEEKLAGKYEVNFNASSLASGVYIYKIQSGSFINSKKMILLK